MALTEERCLAHLEYIRWSGKPTCPYCDSIKSTRMKEKRRYHCNHCFTSYSVTVNTIFHHSHIDLVKWFRAIFLISTSQDKISARVLATEINVTKNTALSMIKRIQKAKAENLNDLRNISAFYKECMDKRKGC